MWPSVQTGAGQQCPARRRINAPLSTATQQGAGGALPNTRTPTFTRDHSCSVFSPTRRPASLTNRPQNACWHDRLCELPCIHGTSSCSFSARAFVAASGHMSGSSTNLSVRGGPSSGTSEQCRTRALLYQGICILPLPSDTELAPKVNVDCLQIGALNDQLSQSEEIVHELLRGWHVDE